MTSYYRVPGDFILYPAMALVCLGFAVSMTWVGATIYSYDVPHPLLSIVSISAISVGLYLGPIRLMAEFRGEEQASKVLLRIADIFLWPGLIGFLPGMFLWFT
jgi:hypothetical protein